MTLSSFMGGTAWLAFLASVFLVRLKVMDGGTWVLGFWFLLLLVTMVGWGDRMRAEKFIEAQTSRGLIDIITGGRGGGA